MKIERTFEISDITPRELAAVFAGYFGNDQAKFFDELWIITRNWPGAGWCQQSCDIASHLTTAGRATIATLASHLPADDIAYIVAGSEQP